MIAENDDVIKKKKSFVCNSREEKLVYLKIMKCFMKPKP